MSTTTRTRHYDQDNQNRLMEDVTGFSCQDVQEILDVSDSDSIIPGDASIHYEGEEYLAARNDFEGEYFDTLEAAVAYLHEESDIREKPDEDGIEHGWDKTEMVIKDPENEEAWLKSEDWVTYN